MKYVNKKSERTATSTYGENGDCSLLMLVTIFRLFANVTSNWKILNYKTKKAYYICTHTKYLFRL